MIRLIAFAAFALVVTTSAQAMPVAPVHEPDGMITQVAYGCGAGRTRVGGVCVARTTKRQVRRCAVWGTFAVGGIETPGPNVRFGSIATLPRSGSRGLTDWWVCYLVGGQISTTFTERDDDSLGVGALHALESTPVFVHPFCWLDL